MGMAVLDVFDNWVNQYGIVAAALVSTVVVAYLVRGLPTLRDHLNHRGSFKAGGEWTVSIAVIAPLVLGVTLVLTTDRKSTRLRSSHVAISYAVFCLQENSG